MYIVFRNQHIHTVINIYNLHINLKLFHQVFINLLKMWTNIKFDIYERTRSADVGHNNIEGAVFVFLI